MHTVGDATSSVPAFLGKLWKLVEDPSTNHLISWNSVKRPFVITTTVILSTKVTCLLTITVVFKKSLVIEIGFNGLFVLFSILFRMA